MKNIIFITLALLSSTFAMAQDTVKYGEPRYMFNERSHGLLYDVSVNYGIIGNEIIELNDTSVMHYSAIRGIGGVYVSQTSAIVYNCTGYLADEPTRVYGIAVPLSIKDPNAENILEAAIFQMRNGHMNKIRTTSTVKRRNLFMFEGDYLVTCVMDSYDTTYVGRHSTLSYNYEFYFDTSEEVIVRDTFYIGEIHSRRWANVLATHAPHIKYYDSVGYPPTADDMFHYRNFYRSGSYNEIPDILEVDTINTWGIAFPIIMPYDGGDDSLGVREVGPDPEVYLAPNPAEGRTVLTSDVPVSRLLIHNADGRMVRELIPGATRVEIDLTGLPGGLYIISAITPFGTAHRKLLVR